jgi:hypothetical protein
MLGTMTPSKADLQREVDRLNERLDQADETITAIDCAVATVDYSSPETKSANLRKLLTTARVRCGTYRGSALES